MTTVELLQQAMALARRSGYQVRQEWMEGYSGGACEIKGRKCLFLDPTSPPADQLEVILDVLWADERVCAIDISAELEEEIAAVRRRNAA